LNGWKKEPDMFKHILLPTDGSDLSATAINAGIRLAKRIGAKVTGLSVRPSQQVSFYEEKITCEALEAETHLASIEKEAREAGVAYDVIHERNDCTYDAIICVAEKKDCDLIMMASHGWRGVKAILIGSETQKVLTHSRIPVLVYR